MASWFTRALDRITPWDRGGEVQRRQEKKKREEEDRRNNQAPSLSVDVAQPNQNISVQGQPKPQKPTNIFEDLNKSLVLNKPQNAIDIIKSQDTSPVEKPEPGTVIEPKIKVGNFNDKRDLILPDGRRSSQIPVNPEEQARRTLERELDAGKSWEDIARDNRFDLEGVKEYSQATRPNYGVKIERPKQSFWNKARDVFDANTEADKWRRQEGNRTKGENKDITLRNPGNIVGRTPIVGHVAKTLNTFGAQIPQASLAVYQAAATREYSEAIKSGDKERIKAAADRVKIVNDLLEASGKSFEKNSGGLFNTGTLFDEEGAREGDFKTGAKDIVAPTAVSMLDLYTLGAGSTIGKEIGKQGVKQAVVRNPVLAAKLTGGNYASGDIDARSQGATNEEAIKSGLLTSILGLGPDIALPAIARNFRNRILPRLTRNRGVDTGDVVEEIDDAAVVAGTEAAVQATQPRPIRVTRNIPIDQAETAPQPVRVRNMNEPRPVIREFPGDAGVATPDPLIQRFADEAQEEAAAAINSRALPDRRIEGVTPRTPEEPFKLTDTNVKTAQDEAIDAYAAFLREIGEGNGVAILPDGRRASNNMRFGDTSGKRMTKAAWREEAERQLREGKADPSIQRLFDEAADPEVQSLLTKGNQTEEAPIGRPIQVKEAKGIPVRDETVVPTDLPETPGQVRATEATAPMQTKSEAVANAPVTTSPAQLSAETQAILDNPKQFNKRQVAAARNQRKMARAVAKAQEETSEALDRIDTASPAAQSGEGFVPTGKFGKSAQGGAYQKVSRKAEMQQALQETSNMSPADVIQTARKNQLDTGGFNKRDIRNIAALFESKRIPRGTPEWNEARAILKEDGTIWGQTGALRNYTMRRTASANELISRYESKIYRLAEDPTKIDSKLFDEVEVAEETYTQARDEALRAYNRFTENPTSVNAKLYHTAQDAADEADVTAKQTEYKVANQALKGNKDVKQMRELEKMANEADMYQMDAVDASMLSGTGTFVRNFVNAAVGGAEEGVFGRPAAWLARKISGESVGGGAGRGSIKGLGVGSRNLADASKARASAAGKNPLEHIKNWTTTGNQLGDVVIDAQASRNTLSHYTQVLKDQGYKGRELTDRASVMARQDPDNVGRVYSNAARVAAGLGGGITRGNRLETFVKNIISDTISAGNPGRISEGFAKLVTRMTIGFPTAIGRSTAEGVKRFTLGAPTFIKAFRTADPQARAILIKEGIKQAGTGGGVIPPLFYAMGSADLITGAYPDDKDERARWERDGITENSIKIGDAYYQLPAYLGAWAVPGLFYASLGRNDGDWAAAAADTAKAVPSLLPTDQTSSTLDVINGRTDLGKFMSQIGAGAVRASTPAGALLNQISKSFDPTRNDTTGGTNLENFVNRVAGGIPGINGGVVDIPDKVDDAGNPIQNPNAAELLFGAASARQGAGEERSAQIQGEVDSALQKLSDIGALGDPNLREILDDKDALIYEKAASGEQLKEGELEDLQEALVKGVSQEGTDTAYLEREQYDTNLAALKLKRELMASDKTVKPSSLEKIDTAIKRGEVYKQFELPYDMIESYQDIGVEDWRKMGDPEEDEYDPDMYQKLWEIDQAMTEAGVSYKKGALDKNKYFLKEKKGGRGGSGSRKMSTDFGKLKEGSFTPQVRAYETIDQQSGSIPVIRTVRPNIVHKIGSSR